MPRVCSTCHQPFPGAIKVDGKWKSLQSRKACLQCVPFRSYIKCSEVYTRDVLVEAVKVSVSFAGVLRFLGRRQSGSLQFYVANKIKQFGIDTRHFTGAAHHRGKPSNKRKTPLEILVLRPEGSRRDEIGQLRRAMVEYGIPEKCNGCTQGPLWNSRPLRLQVDHKNGNGLDNRPDNVRFLCPNCHTQTKNFGSHNTVRYKEKHNLD